MPLAILRLDLLPSHSTSGCALLLGWASPDTFVSIAPLVGLYWSAWNVHVKIIQRSFHPLSRYHGRLLASITRLWLILDTANGSSDKRRGWLEAR